MSPLSSKFTSAIKAIKEIKLPQQQKLQKLPSIPGAQPRPRFEPPAPRGSFRATEATEAIEENPGDNPSKVQQPEHSASVFLNSPVLNGFMLTVGVGLALLCWYVLTNVGALAGWIVGALIIALGLDPLVRRLEKIGLPRVPSVIAVFGTLALAVIGLISWVIPKIASQTVQFINSFPSEFEGFLNSELFRGLDQQFNIRSSFDDAVADATNKLTTDTNIVSTFLNNLINAGSTLANIFTGTLIVLILSLYFLMSLPMMKAWFVRLTPASRRNKVNLLTEKITSAVGNYVMGQAIVALLNGTFALIVMLIIGAPFIELLTLFVVILAFIPLIGGVAAGTLVSVLCLMDDWHTALAFAIPYVIYLQIEAYFISPRIMSHAVAVPGGIAIIAVAAGGSLWGVLGALIGIPVAASLLILVQEVLVPRQDEH